MLHLLFDFREAHSIIYIAWTFLLPHYNLAGPNSYRSKGASAADRAGPFGESHCITRAPSYAYWAANSQAIVHGWSK